MKSENGKYISPPSPEMLAAYVDGEFEGNHLLMARKRSIEDWLENHPEVAEDIRAWRRLKQLMQQTSAEEPAEEDWQQVWAEVQNKLKNPITGKKRTGAIVSWWTRGGAAAAVFLLVGTLAWLWTASTGTDIWLAIVGKPSGINGTAPGGPSGEKPPAVQGQQVADVDSPENSEPFPVLTEDEITIRHVAGSDTATLVIGDPVDGPLVLLEPQDFFLNSIEPAVEDQMVPDIQMEDGPPMIWARNQKELNEP